MACDHRIGPKIKKLVSCEVQCANEDVRFQVLLPAWQRQHQPPARSSLSFCLAEIHLEVGNARGDSINESHWHARK
eukprot:767738-Hanusia_phi.AAC.2